MMREELDKIPTPMMHDVVITRTQTFGRVKFEAIPPEEFLIERQAKSLKDANFVCHRVPTSRSALLEMGFDYDKVYSLPVENKERYNEERSTRFRNLDDDYDRSVGDASTEEVIVYESYIRMDTDGDGIAELRKITSAGDGGYTILDNVPVDSHPFCSLTPIIVPHRFYGRSVSELVEAIKLQGSPQGPVVNLNNIYNTLSRIIENAGLKDVASYFTDPRLGQQMMRPQPKPPTEFEKVSQIQTQQKAAEAQMNYENRMREMELKYQKMILEFETKAKELELSIKQT